MQEVVESSRFGAQTRIPAAAMVDVALGLSAFLLAAMAVLWHVGHRFPMPFYDELSDRVRFYAAATDWRQFLSYLISLHNEHRVATTRIVMALDETLRHGQQALPVATMYILTAGMIALLYSSAAERPRSIAYPGNFAIAGTLVLLLINTNHYFTFLVAFQLQHVIMALLVVLLALAAGQVPDRPDWRAFFFFLTKLVFLALVGSFTLGSSPTLAIGAAAMAIVMRWRPLEVLVLAAVAVVHTAIILLTTARTGIATYDPLVLLKFLDLYLGSPFLRFDPWPAPVVTYWTSVRLGQAFGAIILLAGAGFALMRFVRPGLGGRLAVIGLTLVVVVMITGAAAGVSRAQFGLLEAGSKKYSSFTALAWVGVVLTALAYVRDLYPGNAWLAGIPARVLLVVLVPLTVIGYQRETRIWEKQVDRIRESALAVFMHVNDRDRLNSLLFDHNRLGSYVADIETKNRSIFAKFPFRWGDDAGRAIGRRQKSSCRSQVERLDAIPPADRTDIFEDAGVPMAALGWTWMLEENAVPQSVIAVDSRERIVGIAMPTRTSYWMEEWLGQKFTVSGQWFGYLRLPEGAGPATFFALSANGRSYCDLGKLGDIQ
jgi:hypothetical protein